MMAAARWPERRLPANNQFERPREPDSTFDPVVVSRHLRVIDKALERHPALEAVVQHLGLARITRHLLALPHHPHVQGCDCSVDAPAATLVPVTCPPPEPPRGGSFCRAA